jgi:glycosyltransferase involved in cell wall biosynthesis
MINILYFTNTGKIIGGAETQLAGLIKNLDTSMFNPIVISPNSGEYSDLLTNLKIQVYVCYLPSWKKAISLPFRHFALSNLLKKISKHHIDIVHSSDLWQNYYALQIGKSLGVPTIAHVRNHIMPQRIHKYLINQFDKIIAISERIKDNLIKGGINPEKIEFIGDGVDLTEFQPSHNETNVLRRDFQLHDRLIGLVGRIEPFKRQKDFMPIVAEVVKNRQDVSFLLIGDILRKHDKYLRETIQVVRKYGIYNYVVWTDYRRDMPNVLNSLDILVTLSGGSVIMEARACGIPVIMADKSKQANLIKDDGTGVLNVPDNVGDLSKAILHLLDDEDLRIKMGESGRKRVENFYDIRKTSESTQQIYKSLVVKG